MNRREKINLASMPQSQQRMTIVCNLFRYKIETTVNNAFKIQFEIKKSVPFYTIYFYSDYEHQTIGVI